MNFEKAIQDLIVFSEKKDSLAFDLFFNETKDLIYRVAFHYMRCDAEAEDILQSVFLKIFTYAQEKPQSIKEIKNLKSWLIQITLNASKMLIRSKIRQREKNMKKLTVPNESTDENREQLELVKKYLIELPEKYRLPVCLHYVENMSFSEISSVLKIDQPTIKVQVSRGLEKLRNLLQKAGFTISTSAFSAMLIESSFQKTPSSLTFIPTSKTMGASLDQVIGYSENSAWHAFTLKNILFITFVLLFTGGMMMLFMKKESLMKEGKLITEEPISTFSYNFEKKVPNGIQVASTEKTIIEPNKGLIIPEGNNATTITYEGINFNDQPYIIVNEIFTSKFSSLIQSMYGVNNKKYFWSRPAPYPANSWIQFKIVIYEKYEILYNGNTPFIILELPSKDVLKDELKICYSNTILKNVNIRLLNKAEISEIDKFIIAKKQEIPATETILNQSDLVKTSQKDIYKLNQINRLKKPIEIVIEMKEQISSFDGLQIYFLDSKSSNTSNRNGKPKEEFGKAKIFHIYLYDEISFISNENEPPFRAFESKSPDLNKEIGFKLNKNLVEKITIKSMAVDNKIYEKTINLFNMAPFDRNLLLKYPDIDK